MGRVRADKKGPWSVATIGLGDSSRDPVGFSKPSADVVPVLAKCDPCLEVKCLWKRNRDSGSRASAAGQIGRLL